MEYKVLVRLFVPEIGEEYEIYIPINKFVGEVVESINQLTNSMSSGILPIKDEIYLINRQTGACYSGDTLIRDTDIRNGTELVMIL
ncbi:hypothetical protein IKE98_00840 [Candidatus Saccharibacteria bacterium]|nr:hypothetical protein [Candidatus Saccharibacteria bacterium]